NFAPLPTNERQLRRSPPGRRGQIAGPYGIELGDAPTSPEPNGAGHYVAGDADQGEAPTPLPAKPVLAGCQTIPPPEQWPVTTARLSGRAGA
ncbi:hypothetical protein EKW62_24285, partial [Salmonella enterica]|nr:hypothetical protein [Salmonella enterica]